MTALARGRAHAQLDLAPFARGIGYTLVNLGELIVHAPARVRELFEEVLEHVRTGVLAPLPRRDRAAGARG